ncbi:MAG TPA: hypothetical protein VG826_29915 [Pirellulales bacterium]|nr:hypothetical protein [Pirellulales bacterium]
MVLPRASDLVRVLATVSVLTGAAYAQAPAVVQLPSFSTFGVDTSVSAPDRGSVSLGGVGRSSTGSTAFGTGFGPGNRSFGRSLSGSRTSVRATVHDIEALDRETLARAKGTGERSATPGQSMARRLSAAQQSSAGQVPSGSVAEARRRWAAQAAATQAEALQTLKRAREAAAAGKTSAAGVFYRLAGKEASGELKSQIEREAATIASKPPEPQVADSGRKSGTAIPRAPAIR